ncbi:unnamed protein product [Discosporangium mesarthrocarpum]
MGDEGIHGSTIKVDKKEDCLVCGSSHRTVSIDPARTTLRDLMDEL